MNKSKLAKIAVRVTTVAEKFAATAFLCEVLGAQSGMTFQAIKKGKYDPLEINDFPLVGASEYGGGDVSGHRAANASLFDKVIDFADMFKVFNGINEVKVELNAEYTATVSEKGVKVGCQLFPLDVIDKLVAARNEIAE